MGAVARGLHGPSLAHLVIGGALQRASEAVPWAGAWCPAGWSWARGWPPRGPPAWGSALETGC